MLRQLIHTAITPPIPGRLRAVGLCLAFWLVSAVALPAQAPSESFETGNKLYEQGNFAEAAAQYGKILGAGQASPEVWFNQGNAFFKSGQLGRAIACYRAAERLAPRDPDIRANLRFAREQVQNPKWQPSRWTAWLGRLSLNEWSVLAMIPLWALFLLLATGQWRPEWRPALRSWLWLSSALACLGLAGLLSAWTSVYAPKIVTAAVKEVAVRHGPLEESQKAFTVQDGAELLVTDSKGDWLQVATDDRHSGWIRKDQVQN